MNEPMRVEIVDEAESTSETLKQHAEDGAGEMALMARRQRSGHGRLGRPWVSVEGNLALSVLLRPGLAKGAALRWPGHWSILAGVALAEAVREVAPPDSAIRLKWPNDLLLRGGKVAGILVEVGGISGAAWLVIGFGVNLAAAPAGLDRRVSCLAEVCRVPAAEVFAAQVLRALDGWRRRYDREGFDAVRAAWLASGPEAGEVVVVSGVPGAFRGLADDGALVLETGAGERVIRTGEVE